MKNWLRDNAIHLAIIGIFIAITFVYFPAAWQGKQLPQTDVLQAGAGQTEIFEIQKKYGDAPLWTNSMFGGMPSYQVWMPVDKNIGTYIIRAYKMLFPHPIEVVLLYLLGAYMLFVVIGIKPQLAAVGAIAFAFSSYNFIYIEAGHINKAYAIGLMAPTLAGMILSFRGKYLTGAVILAFAITMEIRVNHVQMAYYLFLVALVLVGTEFYRAVREKKLGNFGKAIGYQAIAVVLAVAVNASLLWPTYEYSRESIRGQANLPKENTQNADYGLNRSYAYEWSQGVGESLSFLIPNVYGGGSSTHLDGDSHIVKLLTSKGVPMQQAMEMAYRMPVYWGDKPFTSGPWYFGAVVVYLFVLGLFIVRSSLKWWLIIATGLVVLLSFGKHFPLISDLFFDYFPLYNKFRAVESILSVAMVLVPMLVVLALYEITEQKINSKELTKKSLYALYITGGVSLIVWLFPDVLLDFKGSHYQEMLDGYTKQLGDSRIASEIMGALVNDRISLAKSDAFRSLLFVVASFGLVLLVSKKTIKASTGVILFGAIMIIDMWSVNKRYLNDNLFIDKNHIEQQFVQEREVDRLILSDKDPNYRVFDLTINPFSDARTSVFHKSIGGYHAAKLMRYQELLEHQFGGDSLNNGVLDMLNTRYLITKGGDGKGNETVHKRPTATGNAWFVEKVTIVDSNKEEMDAINSFEPHKEAFIHKEFEPLLNEKSFGQPLNSSINLTFYRPDNLIYEYNASTDGLAVFSEIWYDKGWKAYLDGKELPILRANYILRALSLPSGQHTVEFKFEPMSYHLGEKISLIASVGLLVIAVLAFWFRKRNLN